MDEKTLCQINAGILLSPAFMKASQIRVAKQQDYGSLMDYFPFGGKSFSHEIFKKAKRLISLNDTIVEPNFESIEDNLLDIINYSSYYYEFLLIAKGDKK